MFASPLDLGLPSPQAALCAALTGLRRACAPRLTPRLTTNSTPMPDSRPESARDDRWVALIQAIGARQDRQAFAELFGHFAPRIKAYLQRTGASEAQAEDV